MNSNSATNQQIKRDFVEREICAGVDSMVNYILSKSYEDSEVPFSWENVTNLYVDKSDEIEEKEQAIEALEKKEQEEIAESEQMLEAEEISEFTHERNLELISEKYADLKSEIEDEISDLESEQGEQQEVYEWWVVSSWLAHKLEERGEVMIEGENIWGRQCSGQAILLDEVISDICESIGILKDE